MNEVAIHANAQAGVNLTPKNSEREFNSKSDKSPMRFAADSPKRDDFDHRQSCEANFVQENSMADQKKRIWAVTLTAMFIAVATGTVRAEYPTYVTLRTPAAQSLPQTTFGCNPGREQRVPTQAYAYGWFGAQPRQHWSRHFGYYRNYTEWSVK